MKKLITFEEFSKSKEIEKKNQLQEEINNKREKAATNFKNLLSEFGVSSIKELSEEDIHKFNDKLTALTESANEYEVNEISFEDIKSLWVSYKVITEWGIPLFIMATMLASIGTLKLYQLVKRGKSAFMKKYNEIKGTVSDKEIEKAADKIEKAKEQNESEVNEGIGTIALGIMLAWAGIQVIAIIAGKIIGKSKFNSEVSPEKLKEVLAETVKKVSSQTGSTSAMLLGTALKINLDKRIDSGELKTVNDVKKAMENYLKTNESTVNESVNESKHDFMARYGSANINLKRGYKHHTEEELYDLYDKLGDLVKTLRVKDVTLVFESNLNESHFKVGDQVKCKASGKTGTVVNLDKEHGEDDEKYYTVKVDGGKEMKYSPDELELMESTLIEAEVKSDEDFKEYAYTVLQNAFGDEFDEAKAEDTIDGILGKVDGDYGKAVGILKNSLS